jgi:hypothetical protein
VRWTLRVSGLILAAGKPRYSAMPELRNVHYYLQA